MSKTPFEIFNEHTSFPEGAKVRKQDNSKWVSEQILNDERKELREEKEHNTEIEIELEQAKAKIETANHKLFEFIEANKIHSLDEEQETDLRNILTLLIPRELNATEQYADACQQIEKQETPNLSGMDVKAAKLARKRLAKENTTP
jgi:hypothetical protein